MKRLKSIVFIICMCIICTVLVMKPSQASAGELLDTEVFQNGSIYPWIPSTSGAGKLDYSVKDGALTIEILCPGGTDFGGEDRWDCSLHYDNIKIKGGNTYKVSFQITSDTEGQFYTYISDGTGGEIWHSNGTVTITSNQRGNIQINQSISYNTSWELKRIQSGETLTFTAIFQAENNVEDAQWVFHFGGKGRYAEYGCFSAGTKLTFSQLSIENKTSDIDNFVKPEAKAISAIRVNQVGYYTDLSKTAVMVVEGLDSQSKLFLVKNAEDEVVYRGNTGNYRFDPDSGEYTQSIDFSSLNVEGTYYIECEGEKSPVFTIGKKIISSLFDDAINLLYQNRAGIAIESKYITTPNQKFMREAFQEKEAAYIQDIWKFDYQFNGNDVVTSNGSQDVTGGWIDDPKILGKTVSVGTNAVWKLQNIYERAKNEGYEAGFADDTMNIPENSNKYPDLLDEARFELEFLLKMIVKSGVYKGMLYSQVSSYKEVSDFSLEDKKRILRPVTFDATYDAAAVFAQGYRLWKDIDEEFANEILVAANAAYIAAKKNPDLTEFPDNEVPDYVDNEIQDNAYWAACELYSSTGDRSFLADAMEYEQYLKFPLSKNGTVFSVSDTASMGSLSLLENQDKLTVTQLSELETNLTLTAKLLSDLAENQSFGLPYKNNVDSESGYAERSNEELLNNILFLGRAGSFFFETDSEKADNLIRSAARGFDYLLGKNALGMSFISGYGETPVTNINHFYWTDGVLPQTVPNGVLAAGPCAAQRELSLFGIHTVSTPVQKQYQDHYLAATVNGYTIPGNAALAAVSILLEAHKEQSLPQKVTVTLQAFPSVGGIVAGEGTYFSGEAVDINAIPEIGYRFDGWYEGTDTEGTLISTDQNTCVSSLSENVAYTAKFTLTNQYTVLISGNGTVSSNGEEIGDGESVLSAIGSPILLSAAPKEGNEFVCWTDKNNRVLSYMAEGFSTYVGLDMQVKAIFQTTGKTADNKWKYQFLHRNGNIILSGEAEDGSKITKPASDPLLVGYRFVGWKQKGQSDIALIDFESVTLTQNMIFEAVFEKIQDQLYSVSVQNGTIKNTSELSSQFIFDSEVTVVAMNPPSASVFSYWKNESDQVVSYDAEYTFSVGGDVCLIAVFEETAAVAVPTIVGAVTNKDTVNRRISFLFDRTMPINCTMIQTGCIATDDAALAGNSSRFTLASKEIDFLKIASSTNGNGQYMWTKTNVASSWYVRGYLTYKNAEGVVQTLYSEILTGTMTE